MTVFQNVRLPLRRAAYRRQRRKAGRLGAGNGGPGGLRSAQRHHAVRRTAAACRARALHRQRFPGHPAGRTAEQSRRQAARRDAHRDPRPATPPRRTILFVTHDQEEAMSIADTIYLFNDGRIEQSGAPNDLYENPRTRYAAEFLGRVNITRQAKSRRASARVPAETARCRCPQHPRPRISVCIRPEKWRAVSRRRRCPETHHQTQYVGDRIEFWVDTPAGDDSRPRSAPLTGPVNDHVDPRPAVVSSP